MIAQTILLNPWVQGIFAVLLLIFVSRRQRYKLPPGPPGLPILGNFLDIPKAREWLTYNEWSRKYGMQNGIMLEHATTHFAARF